MAYVDVEDVDDFEIVLEYCQTQLPSAVQILTTASSLEHLTIKIRVHNRVHRKIDCSPLTVLQESSAFRHIDLYITDVTHTEMVSELARYEGLKKLMEQGVLVIHAEETLD